MKRLVFLLALLAGGVGIGYSAAPALKGPFAVASGKRAPAGLSNGARVLAASSTTAGSLTVDWDQVCVNHDGSGFWSGHFNSTTGQTVPRVWRVDAPCTQVTDNFTNVVYTTSGPSDAVCTFLQSGVTRSNSLLSSCAASAKCNL